MLKVENVTKYYGDFKAVDNLSFTVKPGEIWYVPGGMPHALGENLTLLEIMEMLGGSKKKSLKHSMDQS